MADLNAIDVSMDASSLYREEIITDRHAGTLRVMVPITAMGTTDPARATLYVGEAQLMTQVGPLPISFEVEAKSLAEAVANYGTAAKAAIERTVSELQEMRRQAASGLIVPGSGGGGMGGMGGMGGLPGGGFAPRGGGKLQMP